MSVDPRLTLGLEHFNRREFFEAHDVWEDLWRDRPGDADRIFYQGLIQAAVSCYHASRGNRDGSALMYGSALSKLRPYLPAREGIDMARFLRDFAAWFAGAGAEAPSGIEFPKIRGTAGAPDAAGERP